MTWMYFAKASAFGVEYRWFKNVTHICNIQADIREVVYSVHTIGISLMRVQYSNIKFIEGSDIVILF